MTFWIQHGFGKADKITNVANTGQLTGIVLSPADERREALELTVQTARGQGIALLLDPQLYIHTIAGAVARHHTQHGLDFGTVPWFVSPDEIAAHVAAIVSINQRLDIESIVAPTPHLSSFGDEWSSVSLQYAHVTINSTDRPVYISLVVEASAFTTGKRHSDTSPLSPLWMPLGSTLLSVLLGTIHCYGTRSTLPIYSVLCTYSPNTTATRLSGVIQTLPVYSASCAVLPELRLAGTTLCVCGP